MITTIEKIEKGHITLAEFSKDQQSFIRGIVKLSYNEGLEQGQKLTTPDVLKSFTPEQVLEELEDEENIYDARKYFKSLL
jgi:hypothetical protein